MATAAVTQPLSVLAFPAPAVAEAPDAVSIAAETSLLEIDREIDGILDALQDDIDEFGEPRPENKQRFELFCSAFGEKVDRMGRFIRVMEARSKFCREESARMSDRARGAENRIVQIKSFLMHFLSSRDITKMEGPSFTIRKQRNSQDSVTIEDPAVVPLRLARIELRLDGSDFSRLAGALPLELAQLLKSSVQTVTPVPEAVKQAVVAGEAFPGVKVGRGFHIRIA